MKCSVRSEVVSQRGMVIGEEKHRISNDNLRIPYHKSVKNLQHKLHLSDFILCSKFQKQARANPAINEDCASRKCQETLLPQRGTAPTSFPNSTHIWNLASVANSFSFDLLLGTVPELDI